MILPEWGQHEGGVRPRHDAPCSQRLQQPFHHFAVLAAVTDDDVLTHCLAVNDVPTSPLYGQRATVRSDAASE
jgi:hypothetical protein